MKTKWLDTGMVYGIKYALYTDPEDFYRDCKSFNLPREEVGPWLGKKPDGACTHFMRNKETGELIAMVCILPKEGDQVRVAGLLCHEAVHTWQENVRGMGEEYPSDEFMAYSIQWQAQQLMWSYCEQIGRGK